MSDFLSVVWNVDPVIFSIGKFSLRYYSLLFVAGFPLGYWLFYKFYKRENVDVALLEPLLYILLIGTIVGARLGHCLFYEPKFYLTHPIEILKVWQGGLASHGGVLALVLCVFFYAHKYGRKNGFDALWVFDRLAIAGSIAGCFIRLGNLFNSEIFGGPTTLPWGFKFPHSIEWATVYGPGVYPPDGVACHPTQIYEALGYLILGLVLLWLYWKRTDKVYKGSIFGIFLVALFTLRFLIEFIKNDQVDFEAGMTLNMGQLLSIPFILGGIIILVWSIRHKLPLLRDGYDEEPHTPKDNDHRTNLSKEQRMSASKRKAMGLQ
ncbi:MAG: prolipoprotein diacylglyceryl transferase [Bacteroidales bacterium]|nr:prolipoprotein diacylglyceryl transferase [Bacteroidales bacterium]